MTAFTDPQDASLRIEALNAAIKLSERQDSAVAITARAAEFYRFLTNTTN